MNEEIITPHISARSVCEPVGSPTAKTISLKDIAKKADYDYKMLSWRIIAMSGVILNCLQKINDDICSIYKMLPYGDAVLSHRDDALDYYYKFNTKLLKVIVVNEDFMLDFQKQYIKYTDRKVDAFTNSVMKQIAEYDITFKLLAVHIAVAMKLIDSVRLMRDIHKENFPKHPSIKWPTYIDTAINTLNMTFKHLGAIEELIDPNEHPVQEATRNTEKMFTDLLKMWFDDKLYNKCMKYAEKENPDQNIHK